MFVKADNDDGMTPLYMAIFGSRVSAAIAEASNEGRKEVIITLVAAKMMEILRCVWP